MYTKLLKFCAESRLDFSMLQRLNITFVFCTFYTSHFVKKNKINHILLVIDMNNFSLFHDMNHFSLFHGEWTSAFFLPAIISSPNVTKK